MARDSQSCLLAASLRREVWALARLEGAVGSESSPAVEAISDGGGGLAENRTSTRSDFRGRPRPLHLEAAARGGTEREAGSRRRIAGSVNGRSSSLRATFKVIAVDVYRAGPLRPSALGH